MGFLDRVLPGRHVPASAPRHALPVADLAGVDQQLRSSHQERHDPVEVRIPAMAPPPAPVAPRTDVTQLLGRHLGEPLTQDICREYSLSPALGAGPARSYQAPSLGVSLLADDYGTIINIFLHFHGDLGFTPYPGPIPGRGGTIPKRSSLWVALGRPDQSTDPNRDRVNEYGASDQWRFPTFTMHALYALDNEDLLRLTLRH
ncbi:hypothetical protein [Paractinoplanes globisporus]|uniref:Uncharacterized protein n=1 Tax=Paractinoplanes globisporus TaxID=113565 RepID=A0ABW6WBZ1_9ACTN|nr:hypothetical protein [Actinoplanes globisporus]